MTLRTGMTLRPGITVTFSDDGDDRLALDYRSASNIAQVLVGKPAELAPDLLGALFAVCPSAQQLAARSAIAAEGGAMLAQDEFATMTRSVRFETLREHGVRVLLDWPQAMDEEPPRAELAALINLTRERDGKGLADHIAHTIFGRGEADWLAIESLQELDRWAVQADNVAARFIRHSLDAENLRLAFGPLRPPLLDRYRAHPLVKALKKDVMTACHVARLIDLAMLALECRIGVSKHQSGPVGKADGVACSRGELFHKLSLKDGMIASYQIHSPTDALFATGGLGEQWLKRVSKSPPQSRMGAARRVMHALDPCVEYVIEAR